MKKLLLLFVLLFLTLPHTIFAENSIKIIDEPDVLTSEEETILASEISDIIAKYNFDVVVYFSNDASYSDIYTQAAEFYENNNYGIGSNHEGILLIVNFALEGDNFYLMTTGEKCIYDYFPDEVLEDGYNAAFSGFSEGEFYTGTLAYLNWIEANMYEYYNYYSGEPEPVKEPTLLEKIKDAAGISAAISAAISAIATAVLKGQLKTEHKQHAASNYIKPYSFDIHRAGDLYLYTTRSVTRIPRNDPPRTGGGGGVRPSGHASTFKGPSGEIHGGGRNGRHI